MVCSDIDAVPCFEGRPICGRICPKWIISWKAERQKDGHTEIHAARVDIILRHMDLAAGISNAQPAICIEGAWLAKLALGDGCEGAAHLCRIDILRKQMQICSI